MAESESSTEKLKFWHKYKFPKGAALLIVYQFFSGMGVYAFTLIFPIYMTSMMMYSDATATSFYHARAGITFCMNIVGAIIADSYLGRIKTFLIFYPIDILMYFGVFIFSIYETYTTLVTVVLISAVLCGMYGSAMRAFVGDQIPETDQVMLSTFLHMIYLINNLGIIIIGFVGPIIHKDIYCFKKECYPLNFVLTVLLMLLTFSIVGLGLFLRWFVIKLPTKNIFIETLACIGYGMKCRFQKGRNPGGHWMDYAEDKYGVVFVHDCKVVLGLIFFLLGHPIFFTVFEQMSSVWTFQARYMDGMVTNDFILKADHIQTLNPILVVILIPIFEMSIYPILDKINFKVPYRISVGQYFTAISCFFMVLNQYFINQSLMNGLNPSETGVKVLNSNSFPIVLIDDKYNNQTIPPQGVKKTIISSFGSTATIAVNQSRFNISVFNNSGNFVMAAVYFNNSIFTSVTSRILSQDDGGYSKVRLLNINGLSKDEEIFLNGKFGINKNFHLIKNGSQFGDYVKCEIGTFELVVKSKNSVKKIMEFVLHPGQTELIYVYNENGKLQIQRMTEYKVHLPKIYWQFFPYLFVTIGEVFFNVNTGIFLYSEAPASMKSVLLSAQYMCIALGDVIIIILSSVFESLNLLYFFVLCTVLVFISGLVTTMLGRTYLKEKERRDLNIFSKSSENI